MRHSSYHTTPTEAATGGCCLFQFILLFALLLLGPISLHYIIWAGWGIDAPYGAALVICGIIFSETTLPVAAILWLVVSLGVHTPLFVK